MKVRVSFTVDVADDIRREINAHFGLPGLADRDAIKSWYESHGHSQDDDLGWSADCRARGTDIIGNPLNEGGE